MSDRYVIGVDGGGTKTHAAAYILRDNQLSELTGESTSGACNIAFMPLAESSENFVQAIEGCGIPRDQISAIGGAVAGYSFASRREPFASAVRAHFGASKVELFPDFLAAYRAALPDGAGILVVAGTGSVAYGAGNEGRSHRAGGYGYLIDDAGSAYGVGREAVAAVLQEIDGSGPATTLSSRLQDDLGVSGWDALIEGIYSGSVDRVRIASLSVHVSKSAAEDNDAVSARILMRAGGALARLAETVHRHIFDSDQAISIARTGSLWQAGSALTDVFARSCERFSPGCAHVSAADRPAYGAALIALDSLK